MKDKVSTAATITLTICAIIITVMVVRRELFPVFASAETVVRNVENWSEIAARDGCLVVKTQWS